jgi:hypothetical protein
MISVKLRYLLSARNAVPINSFTHRNQTINRKGTYILADIHGMDHFRPKLAPQPYNKLQSFVSKIHTPMVMVWFGYV